MTTQVLTGLLLVLLPVAYNLCFTLLARGFDYPDILRRPTRSWSGSPPAAAGWCSPGGGSR